MKQQIISDFLGSLSIVNYIVAFAFVFLALVAKWCIKTLDGVKNSPKTPDNFSWTYWLKDNLIPKLIWCILAIITTFLCLRFSNEIIGMKFSYVLAVSIGFGLDYYIDRLKKMEPKLAAEVVLRTEDKTSI